MPYEKGVSMNLQQKGIERHQPAQFVKADLAQKYLELVNFQHANRQSTLDRLTNFQIVHYEPFLLFPQCFQKTYIYRHIKTWTCSGKS